MPSIYRLDKSFGPGGSFAGIILVIIGLILTPFYWTAAILIVIGAFTGFSGSACEIDTAKRRIRQCQLHFGIFKSGDWRNTDTFQGIRVVHTKRSYRTYSLSSRVTYKTTEDHRVVLEAGTPQSRIEVMKCISMDDAIEKAQRLANELGMKILKD